MVQMCAGSTVRVKLECSPLELCPLWVFGQYICGLYQHETVQIIILCSNHLEYKNYAFTLEKGEFQIEAMGVSRGVRQFVSTPFFSYKDC